MREVIFAKSELCVRKWAAELEQCHIAYYTELVKLKFYTHVKVNRQVVAGEVRVSIKRERI